MTEPQFMADTCSPQVQIPKFILPEDRWRWNEEVYNSKHTASRYEDYAFLCLRRGDFGAALQHFRTCCLYQPGEPRLAYYVAALTGDLSPSSGCLTSMQRYIHKVERGLNCYDVILDDRRRAPVRHGHIISSFHSGWEPAHVFSGFAPIYLLELVHTNGSVASWFLDENMNRLADRLDNLPLDIKDAVTVRATELFLAIWGEISKVDWPQLSGALGAFYSINRATRASLLESCSAALERTVKMIVFRPGDRLNIADLGYAKIRETWLDLLLTHGNDPSPWLASGIEQRSLDFISPIDGRPLRTDVGIVLHALPSIVAYRVRDPAYDLTFYVIAISLGWAKVPMVFFPDRETLFVRPGAAEHMEVVAEPIRRLLVEHMLNHAPEIERYISAPKREYALVFNQGLVGHELWNELGEIDRLIRSEPEPILPPIYLLGGAKAEHYGPIDKLFPEAVGKLNRGLDRNALALHSYEQNLCMIGPSNQYISKDLRRRVLDYNLNNSVLLEAKRQLEEIGRYGDCPIILVGLRTQNRTLTNLAEFCVELAEFTLTISDRIALVFDGWNAGGSPVSIAQEKAIVAQVRDSVSDRRLVVVDTIGRSLSESIFWAAHATFFISLWGAGLAKYRWVANKRGLVITSQWNLQHRLDLHIYDSPDYMEDPSQLEFIDPGEAKDDSNKTSILLNPTHPVDSLINFRVNHAAVFERVRRLLP